MTRAATGVVILNFGDPSDALRCLASLEMSDDLDLDIVVMNNGPEDLLHDQLTREVGGRAHVISTGENLGYAAGNNAGIEWVTGRGCDFVWILNPDTVVAPETLTELRSTMNAVPDCGIVGPRLVLPGSPPRVWFDAGRVDPETAVTRHVSLGVLESRAPAPTVVDADYVTGASILVRRSVIEQVGGIPEQYFLYYEEVDWCRRVQAAGWRTMVNQHARMTHFKRSSGKFPEPYYLYYMTRNRYHFAQDCLGVDGEIALANLDAEFLSAWRAKVSSSAPRWLPTFDEIVSRAKEDARAGVYGRTDLVSEFPSAEEDAREPAPA